ncbi:MAG: Ig domain-containing protein, partial [Clostridia bacterium]|nr:Ig domain-containing protein [Clostridia bacterium]
PYIGYAKQTGLTVGVGNNKFGMGIYARMDEMATFALRGLGYSDLTRPADFTVPGSVAFAKQIGMLDSDKVVTPFTRGEAVDIVFGSIGTNMKGQNYDLLSKLMDNGAVTQAQYDKAMEIVGGTTPASNLSDGTYTMTCLGKYFRVNSGKLELRDTTPAQSFTVINKSGGYAYIQTSDGKYLTLSSTTQGTQVTTGSTAYPWLILNQSGSAYAIYPYNAADQVINANGEKSDNGTKIIIWPGSGSEKHALITMTAAGATVDPTSVTLDKTALTLAVGETYDLTAKLAPTNSKISLTWSSNSTGVATVGSSGLVKGVKAGTATITVKSHNGLTATCQVTVTDKYTDKKVNLYNSTTQNVTDIRISSTQNSDWGSNLTSGTVKPDASVAILVPVSSTDYTYDIKVTYADGSTATFSSYNFKNFTSGGSLYAYINNGRPTLSTTKPTVADTTAASAALTSRFNKSIERYNALVAELNKYDSLKSDSSFVNTINSVSSSLTDMGKVIGEGTGLYTEAQIKEYNSALDSLDGLMNQLDTLVTAAKAEDSKPVEPAKPAEPASKIVTVVFVNGTNADFTGFRAYTSDSSSQKVTLASGGTTTLQFTVATSDTPFTVEFTESINNQPYSMPFTFKSSLADGARLTVRFNVENGSIVYSES